MFCHDADNIQVPIRKFQRQELDSLLNNAVIVGLSFSNHRQEKAHAVVGFSYYPEKMPFRINCASLMAASDELLLTAAQERSGQEHRWTSLGLGWILLHDG
jgi:hypothetical protein